MTERWPNTWVPACLGDVAEIRSGLAKGRRNLKSPVTRPYLRVANVQDGRLALESVKEIEVEANEVARYELQDGDVLMTEGGDFDKLGRGTVWRDEIPGCLHQNHVFAVRPLKGLIDPNYLAAVSSSKQGRRFFEESAKQTTNLASINASQLRAYPLVLPPLAEQQRIVSIVRAWTTFGHRQSRLLARKAAFRHGLAEQLLTGRRRFRGFGTEPWRYVRLGEYAQESTLRNVDGLPIGRVMAVRKDRGIAPMRDGLASADLGRYMTVRTGWFAYNPMRLNIGSIAQWAGPEPVLVSPDYVVFRSDDTHLDSRFLHHVTQSHQWRSFVNASGNGGVRVRSYFQDIARMPLSLPPIEEQRAIAGVLDALDREIKLLGRLQQAYDRQRRAVAELLLTGNVRVPT